MYGLLSHPSEFVSLSNRMLNYDGKSSALIMRHFCWTFLFVPFFLFYPKHQQHLHLQLRPKQHLLKWQRLI